VRRFLRQLGVNRTTISKTSLSKYVKRSVGYSFELVFFSSITLFGLSFDLAFLRLKSDGHSESSFKLLVKAFDAFPLSFSSCCCCVFIFDVEPCRKGNTFRFDEIYNYNFVFLIPAVMMISEPQSANTSPSIQYGTGESVDVDEVLELDGTGSYSNGSGPTPIITSPPDVDFSDTENNGLTSPNLVSSMNPPTLSGYLEQFNKNIRRFVKKNYFEY